MFNPAELYLADSDRLGTAYYGGIIKLGVSIIDNGVLSKILAAWREFAMMVRKHRKVNNEEVKMQQGAPPAETGVECAKNGAIVRLENILTGFSDKKIQPPDLPQSAFQDE